MKADLQFHTAVTLQIYQTKIREPFITIFSLKKLGSCIIIPSNPNPTLCQSLMLIIYTHSKKSSLRILKRRPRETNSSNDEKEIAVTFRSNGKTHKYKNAKNLQTWIA